MAQSIVERVEFALEFWPAEGQGLEACLDKMVPSKSGAGRSLEGSSLHRGHDGHVNALTVIIYIFPPSVRIMI